MIFLLYLIYIIINHTFNVKLLYYTLIKIYYNHQEMNMIQTFNQKMYVLIVLLGQFNVINYIIIIYYII